jgi:predicted TIM-barrel fold metal-dependent hydrolase
LLRKKEYENVYADISFTLHDPNIYPFLKKMLADDKINSRILFGTDYYVAATVAKETDLIKMINAKLTSAEMQLIAYENPIRFLSNTLQAISR